MEKLLVSIATVGKIGYVPASGTMGTLVALPIAYFCSLVYLPLRIIILICATCLSYVVIQKALQAFRTKDPSQIIIDEVIGCLVTFFAIPFSLYVWSIGFLLFRFFDIFKPFGIQKIEKLPGVWGVLLDDMVAGFFAHLVLWYFFI